MEPRKQIKNERIRPSLSELSVEQREIFADNLRERVYSTITLIAVLTVLWQNGQHSAIGAIGAIAGSVIALWLATLISIRMSYRAVHGKPIDRRNYTTAFFTASGLLAPAIVPVVIIALAGVSGFYTLKTALLASIIVSLLFLFVLSFQAGRKIYDSFGRLLLVSILEMSVGVLVVMLKLLAGE